MMSGRRVSGAIDVRLHFLMTKVGKAILDLLRNLRTIILGAVVLKAEDEMQEVTKLADRIGRFLCAKYWLMEPFSNGLEGLEGSINNFKSAKLLSSKIDKTISESPESQGTVTLQFLKHDRDEMIVFFRSMVMSDPSFGSESSQHQRQGELDPFAVHMPLVTACCSKCGHDCTSAGITETGW